MVEGGVGSETLGVERKKLVILRPHLRVVFVSVPESRLASIVRGQGYTGYVGF